ncbi:hypothetical protein G7046_g5912 [Stylonectria norvegica]|nr:hypothetical protein G7046_g5912 [Stylonectria norvegica]
MADMMNGKFRHDNMDLPSMLTVMPLFNMRGRTAIVTGAGAGIGLAVARGLAEAGANVAIWYNTNDQAKEEAKNIAEQFGVMCQAYKVDVTSPLSVWTAIHEIVHDFNGRLDIFVANSGIAWKDGAFLDGSENRMTEVLDVNLNGVIWCAKAAGMHFRRQKHEGTTMHGKRLDDFLAGSFIATASMSGSIVNVPQLQAVYNASKAAVIHLCKSLAVEWTGFARCNTVSPGYIRTEMVHFADPKMREQWRDRIVMGREGEVSELRGAYVYLASDASSYVTGLDLIIDGGYSLP